MYHDHSDKAVLALPAIPCRCPEALADPREMTCLYCGHQVGGVPMPSTLFGFRSTRTPAARTGGKRPRYRSAP